MTRADAGGVAREGEADETGLAAECGVGLCAIAAVGDGAGAWGRRAEALSACIGGADVVGVGALRVRSAILLEADFAATRECDALETACAGGCACFQADAREACAEANASVSCGAKDGVCGGGIAGLAFVGGGDGFTSAVATDISSEAKGALCDIASGVGGGLFGADLDVVAAAVGGKVDTCGASVGVGLADGAAIGAILEAAGIGDGLGADVDTELAVVAIATCLARLVEFGAGAAFVDAAIAVVIGGISAGFGAWLDVACASSPLSADAGFCSIFANADATGIGGARITGSSLAGGANAAAFVDLVVAVVVEVVAADFGGGGFDFVVAGAPLTAATGADSRSAHAIAGIGAIGLFGASRGSGITDILIAIFANAAAFVGLSVAVVVFVVSADL